jgi:D-xylose transport system permease protein
VRRRASRPGRSVDIVVRTAVLAVVAFAAAVMFNQYKGLPLALLLFLLVLVITDFVLRRTTYGRKIFALGGSVEASRRAGINVTAVRVSVFAIAGFFAAVGGLFWSSKIAAANQSAGTGDLLMNVIAAAVIGGTSLFGGRGRTWNALLGVMVITSIQYGLALEGIATPVQYMITGGVLLATVVIDSITRKTQKTAGARSAVTPVGAAVPGPLTRAPLGRSPLRTSARHQWRCPGTSCARTRLAAGSVGEMTLRPNA